MKTRDLVICALFAAMTAILAQISIPFPGGVPLTLQLLSISLCGVLLGSKRGFMSILVYIILGAIGLPVFAGFSGFIISFPLVALIIGFVSEKTNNLLLIFLSTILGLVVNYTVGTLMFATITNSSISTSLAACVIPFVLTDLIKCSIATVIGAKLKEKTSIKAVLN